MTASEALIHLLRGLLTACAIAAVLGVMAIFAAVLTVALVLLGGTTLAAAAAAAAWRRLSQTTRGAQ